jgi:hypothetical protein
MRAKKQIFGFFFFFGLFGGNRPNGLKVFGISMFLPNGFIRVLVPIWWKFWFGFLMIG